MSVLGKKQRVSGSLGRCILPLLDALGWKGGKRTFLNALPYDYRDFNIHDMMNTMASLGFKVNSSKGSFSKLDTRLVPCLCVNKKNEPYVLLNYEKKEFLCFEGASSSFKTIKINSSASTFYFFDNMTKSAINPENPQREWFLKFITRFQKPVLMAFMLSLLLTFTALMSPLIVMGIYKQINIAESLSGFWIIGAGIFGILVVDLLLRVFRNRILTYLGARMGYLVSTQVFKRILSFSPTSTENASVGSQIVRMRDFASVRAFIEGSGMTSVMELPFFIILFIGLIIMGGALAYIPVVAGLLLLIFSLLISPLIKKINSESAASGSKKQEFLIEFFSEFRAIKMSGLSKKWREKFDTISSDSSMGGLKTANINSVINGISQATVQAAGVLTIGMGVLGVLNGKLSGAVLIAAMMLVWKILSPITSGFSVFSQSVRIKKSLMQLNRLMAMPLETVDDDMASVSFQGRIAFKGVSLRYKPDYYPALLGLEINIDKGDFIVIKGHEGAGKTTFLKLIMGMYKPQAGGITIDGTNIQQLPPSLLRRSITYLPQEDTLFSVSIGKNIKYYSPASSEGDINTALNSMGLLEEINAMPDKMDTQISQLRKGGDFVSLSRRLCLARSFINKTNIVLLDEPAAGLKEEHLKLLMDTLDAMKPEKTIIIASNHPALIKLADKVVTFDMGTITNIEQPEEPEQPEQPEQPLKELAERK